MDEWIKKFWYTYAIEYYSEVEKIKSCHLDGTLCLVEEAENRKYHVFSFICRSLRN